MSTTEVLSYNQHKGLFADIFLLPQGSKSISTYKKVLAVTTDESSLQSSKDFVKHLHDVIKELPFKKEEFNKEIFDEKLLKTKSNLLEINKVFGIIETLFDLHSSATIDDPIMLEVLGNLEKAKNYLLYIADYINLATEVSEADALSKEKGHIYDLDQFIELLTTNAA